MHTPTAQHIAPASQTTLWAIGRDDGSYTEIAATGLEESEARKLFAEWKALGDGCRYWLSPIRPAKGGV